MANGGADDVELRWEAAPAHIDLDRWGAAYVEVTLRRRKERSSVITRYAFWVIAALAAMMFALTRDLFVLGWAIVTLVAAVGAVLWNRTAARRLTGKLRAIPAASEAFSFAATERGTRSVAASGSDELSWSRYRDVLVLEDLFVLVLDTEVLRFLPRAALVSPITAEGAVEAIARWIDGARLDEPRA